MMMHVVVVMIMSATRRRGLRSNCLRTVSRGFRIGGSLLDASRSSLSLLSGSLRLLRSRIGFGRGLLRLICRVHRALRRIGR